MNNKLNIFNTKRIIVGNYIPLDYIENNEKHIDIFGRSLPDKVVSITLSLINQNKTETITRRNREGFTYFKDCFKNKNRIFIYSTIYCDEPRRAVFTFNVSGNGKVWINNRYVYGYMNEYYWSFKMIEVELHSGINTIVAELEADENDNVFNITVSDYNYEISNNTLSLANTDSKISNSNCFIWLMNNDFLPTDQSCHFSLLQSCDKFQENFEIEIYDWTFTCIDKFEGVFNTDLFIALDKYRQHNEPFNLKNIMIKCILKDRLSGEELSTERIIYISDLQNAMDTIISKAIEVLKTQSGFIYNDIMGKVEVLRRAYKFNEYAKVYWGLRQMNDLIYKLEKNEISQDFYTKPGNHDLFIASNLDKKYVNIKAYVPKSYTRAKSMPVIFALATSKEGYFTQRMDFSKLDEDCLCFDITGRGYTSGSYIGEASIIELINWVLDNFNIDLSRMYLLGYSNGAFATWSIAQNHPDRFAAIFPLAGLCLKNKNITFDNCKTFQIISSSDYLYKKQEEFIDTWRSSNSNVLYIEENMLHVSMYPHLTNHIIINKMMKCINIGSTINSDNVEKLSTQYFTMKDSYSEKGLLSVYCGSVRIVIDDNASNDMEAISIRFSRPTSNGMDTEIDVNYPVYKFSSLDPDWNIHNIILLHNILKSDNSMDYIPKKQLMVDCLPQGFFYNNTSYIGGYVYMQQIKIHEKDTFMLLIITNNDELLDKHILLRKVVIPSYHSGLHPYWNSKGLLYYNNKYVVVNK